MIVISHRGILEGELDVENSPDAIEYAIKLGFYVEVDLRFIDNKLFLGHDQPQYEITYEFLEKNWNKLLVHCKNIQALIYMNNFYPFSFYFSNQSDNFTITSTNKVLTNSLDIFDINTLYLSPELYGHKFTKLSPYICNNLLGVITDFPLQYEEYLLT